MSFPAYPEYKDSGIDWLGPAPAHWSVRRLRHVARLNPGKSEVRRLPPETDVTFLPMEAVGEDGSLDRRQTKPLSDVIEGYTYLGERDVAFAKITPCFENGKAALATHLKNKLAFATTELTVLRPDTRVVSARYLYRLVTSQPFRELGEASMYGAGGQKRVPDNFARDFAIPLPPADEQRKIADFLDHETARIDALIEEQQRLIGLLAEKRQSVLSRAVTQGLNPNTARKDSGVEWLGEIPAHWDLGKLGHYATLQSGFALGNIEPGEDPIYVPYLRVANVQDGTFDLTDVKYVEAPAGIASRYSLRKGDVLMNEGGDNNKLGRGAVWNAELEPCLHQNHVFSIRTSGKLLAEWLSLFTKSDAGRVYFYLFSKQSTNLASISSTNIMNCPLPIPPIDEQRGILDQLSTELSHLDRSDQASRELITLLQERRQALISACVSGKIDVRRAQAYEHSVSADSPMDAEKEAPYG